MSKLRILFTVILIFMSTVCWGGEKAEILFKDIDGWGRGTTIKRYPLGLVCVEAKTNAGFSISCNWEAYNKRQEEKKDGK